jgi:hypothetical protein
VVYGLVQAWNLVGNKVVTPWRLLIKAQDLYKGTKARIKCEMIDSLRITRKTYEVSSFSKMPNAKKKLHVKINRRKREETALERAVPLS